MWTLETGRRQGRPLLALMTVALLAVGCGDDGAGSSGASDSDTEDSAVLANPIQGEQDVVIKTHANIMSITDAGEVLDGTTLDGSDFCADGQFFGGHGSLPHDWLDGTFVCPEGTLTVGFDPRGKGRIAEGPWKVVRGTKAFEGVEGSGRVEIEFAPGPTPATADQTFTGTISG